MSLFHSYCFSFQTKNDLVLVKFTTCSSSTFSENFQKICRETSVIQNGFACKGIFTSFLNTFLWLLLNIKQKRIILNHNFVWCKFSRVIKDLPKSGSPFLIKCPGILRSETFLFSLRENFTYFLKCIPLKKNPLDLKGFILKIAPDQLKL